MMVCAPPDPHGSKTLYVGRLVVRSTETGDQLEEVTIPSLLLACQTSSSCSSESAMCELRRATNQSVSIA